MRAWDYYENQGEAVRGLSRAATIVDSVRAANPGRVILLDAGDLLQGNPLAYVAAKVSSDRTNPIIAAMNAMQYDAAAIGNHEYNYGVPYLDSAVRQARFPFLSANTYRLDPAGIGDPPPGVDGLRQTREREKEVGQSVEINDHDLWNLNFALQMRNGMQLVGYAAVGTGVADPTRPLAANAALSRISQAKNVMEGPEAFKSGWNALEGVSLTLYREIKKLRAGTVAIIVTAYASSTTAETPATAEFNKGVAAYVEVLLTGRSVRAQYVLGVTAAKR